MSACDFCDAVILSLQKIKDRGTVQIVMPRRPVIDAHVLIMPLRHVERVDQLTTDEMNDVLVAVRDVHYVMQKVFDRDDYNLFVNNGYAAGQHIPHVHFHYFGRSQKEHIDPFTILNNKELDDQRMQLSADEIMKKIEEYRNIVQ